MCGIKAEYLWKNFLSSRKAAVFLMVLLSGCGKAYTSQGPSFPSSMVLPYQSSTVITASDTFTPSPTSTGIASNLTTTQTASPRSTWTMTPTATNWPTPTRGLPPSATPGPQEECPIPTYAKVSIHFSEKVSDYGPQILEYIRANGDRAGLDQQIEKLGRNVEEVNNTTGEKKTVFIPDKIVFTEADVTGDQTKEIIMTIMQPSAIKDYDMGIYVVGCRGNQYQLLSDGNFPFSWQRVKPNWSRIDAIRDFNANGISEIIFSGGDTNASGGGDMDMYSYVLEWNGAGFRSLLEEQPYRMGIWSYWNFPEFQDMDGNGTTDILFPRHIVDSACDEPVTLWKNVYMWDGGYYRSMWDDPGEPSYRFQAAFNADYYIEIKLYDRSEASYRRAINDSSLKPYYSLEWGKENNRQRCDGKSPEPNEPQRIIAYARFRLLELNIYLHEIGAAKSGVLYLADNYKETTPGYRYALLAITFWDAYSVRNKIDDACAAVRYEAAQFEEEVFGPMNYGKYYPVPSLETICPFHSE